jgi:hypothetical protein
MNQQLVVETTRQGLRPLGIGGQQIQDSWGKIDAYLRDSLGDAPADILAEPQPTSAGLAWFCRPEGEVVPYGALEEAKAAALIAELDKRLAAIRARIAELKAGSRDSDRTLAETLERALVVPERRPGREFLYSVNGEPVLVNWGTRDESAEASTAVLQDFLRRERAPKPPPRPLPEVAAAAAVPPVIVAAAPAVTPGARLWVWPLWLLFAALVGSTMYLLLAGCSLGLPDSLRPQWLSWCPGTAIAAPPDPGLAAEEDRHDALQQELLELERRIAQLPRCEPPPPEELAEVQPEPEPEPGPEVIPEPEPEPEIIPEPEPEPDPAEEEAERRVEDAGGQTTDQQITLFWDGDADLDLHLVCPDGSRVSWQEMTSRSCGAELNIDANRSGDELMRDPVEHIIWPNSDPPSGHYLVIIDNYAGRSTGPSGRVPYNVRIETGETDETVTGSIAPNDGPVIVYEFEVP